LKKLGFTATISLPEGMGVAYADVLRLRGARERAGSPAK